MESNRWPSASTVNHLGLFRACTCTELVHLATRGPYGVWYAGMKNNAQYLGQ
jgi:hypothetical protein